MPNKTTLKSCTFPIAAISAIKPKVLSWLQSFSTFCFLDNQQYSIAPHEAECLVAAGVKQYVTGDDLAMADTFFAQPHWVFGHLSYELKNRLHRLSATRKEDPVGFAPFLFFTPQIVLEITAAAITLHADDPAAVYAQINTAQPVTERVLKQPIEIQPQLTKEEYVEKVRALQAHIHRGDCYEINFCQAFLAGGAHLHPVAAFQKLMDVSPNPFSALYRSGDQYLVCASPERFLLRQEKKLVSQPIKGTIQRHLQDSDADAELKKTLRLSQKEQSENVMVVDLVRNDLTKVCRPSSVRVEELFGIYSFPQVHQMISTISGIQLDGLPFSHLMEAVFPMGSMTGAPKLAVMKLIDAYETLARGIFSGSVGYKSPNGNFDFNVVIRSIMYNAATRQLTYQVGSGITFYSDAEKEWEECMLKAEAIRSVLS